MFGKSSSTEVFNLQKIPNFLVMLQRFTDYVLPFDVYTFTLSWSHPIDNTRSYLQVSDSRTCYKFYLLTVLNLKFFKLFIFKHKFSLYFPNLKIKYFFELYRKTFNKVLVLMITVGIQFATNTLKTISIRILFIQQYKKHLNKYQTVLF